MKVFIFSISVILITSFVSQKKTRIIFFGDSITQAGVNAGGYIMRIDSMCKGEGKADSYEFIGAGIGGNKVYDLYLRIENDVLARDPDVVVIYVGVNDVWHKSSSGTGTDADKFEKFYQAIIDKLKAKNIRIILCTPAAIGEKTDFSNPQDGDMNEYSNIIRQIAKKNELRIVDLRKAFLDYNVKNNSENKDRGILTTDRVHLNAKGNQLVADEMWKVLKNL
ncbi:MAG TPA: GDSL-type esterase/lipase family protein [Chitinophagaceae bacterium]|jgi:lysophospholipase L1-like esterase|nr:GDSL-type esterase/lipase family protein [Chitinophagaceae bacterium]